MPTLPQETYYPLVHMYGFLPALVAYLAMYKVNLKDKFQTKQTVRYYLVLRTTTNHASIPPYQNGAVQKTPIELEQYIGAR